MGANNKVLGMKFRAKLSTLWIQTPQTSTHLFFSSTDKTETGINMVKLKTANLCKQTPLHQYRSHNAEHTYNASFVKQNEMLCRSMLHYLILFCMITSKQNISIIYEIILTAVKCGQYAHFCSFQ